MWEWIGLIPKQRATLALPYCCGATVLSSDLYRQSVPLGSQPCTCTDLNVGSGVQPGPTARTSAHLGLGRMDALVPFHKSQQLQFREDSQNLAVLMEKGIHFSAFHLCLKHLAYTKWATSTAIADEAIAWFLFQSCSPHGDNSGIEVFLIQNNYVASNVGNLFHGNWSTAGQPFQKNWDGSTPPQTLAVA